MAQRLFLISAVVLTVAASCGDSSVNPVPTGMLHLSPGQVFYFSDLEARNYYQNGLLVMTDTEYWPRTFKVDTGGSKASSADLSIYRLDSILIYPHDGSDSYYTDIGTFSPTDSGVMVSGSITSMLPGFAPSCTGAVRYLNATPRVGDEWVVCDDPLCGRISKKYTGTEELALDGDTFSCFVVETTYDLDRDGIPDTNQSLTEHFAHSGLIRAEYHHVFCTTVVSIPQGGVEIDVCDRTSHIWEYRSEYSRW